MRRTGSLEVGEQEAEGGAKARLRALLVLLLLGAENALGQDKRTSAEVLRSEKLFEPPAIQRRIVISIPDRKLALLEGERVVKVYPVAVGKKATPSPSGAFKVLNRLMDPTWYASGKAVAPGKENPLGTRWIGFSERGHGIHGTNAPSSIGRAASKGCIRMHNADVEDLFSRVRVGDVVELAGERTALVARIFGEPEGKPAGPAAQPGVHVATMAMAVGNL